MIQCDECRKEIEGDIEEQIVAFDLQKNNAKNFCSVKCLKNWMTMKIVWMCIALLLGLIIAVSLFSEMGGTAVTLFFLPYMIRQVRHSLGDMFSEGTFGEFVSLSIVLLGTLTVVYPAYKLYKEVAQYVLLKNRYSF